MNVRGTHQEIIEKRQKRYKQDPVGYIKLLFEDANIETLLVDTGYPTEAFSGYSIDLNDFSKMVPSIVREIFRIDLVIYDFFLRRLSFEAAVEEIRDRIKNAVKNGAVGLKSVVAYRTGRDSKGRGGRSAQSLR